MLQCTLATTSFNLFCSPAIWAKRNLLIVCILHSNDMAKLKKKKLNLHFFSSLVSLPLHWRDSGQRIFQAIKAGERTIHAKCNTLITLCKCEAFEVLQKFKCENSHEFCRLHRYIGNIMMLKDVSEWNKNQKYNMSVFAGFMTPTKWKIADK